MAEPKQIAPALERLIAPQISHTTHPDLPETVETENRRGLDVTVVFTSEEATLAALREANVLADRLNARITLIALQLVPYPAPITSPPVLIDFAERRLRSIAAASRVDTRVRVYLCRDQWDALTVVLKPRSLLVLGTRKRWWPTAEARMAAKLRRAGHQVVVTEME